MTTDSHIQRLEAAYAQLEAELQRPEVAQRLRNAPGENEWSALQVLGHTIEMIPYWLHHCQILIAHTGEPPQFGRSPDAPERLEGVERGARGNADELLPQLKHEIEQANAALRAMSANDIAKSGIHIRRGLMTVSDILEVFIVAHVEDHVAQIRKAVQA